MRTNIEIEERLIRDAMKATGLATKKDTVRAGLQLLLKMSAQRDVRTLRGSLNWDGDLDDMRRDR